MSDGTDTDESLLGRFARGEAVAFEALYRRYERRTWRYLHRHLGNRAVAEEAMQEVWFSVAREAARYRPTARFTTWLFTIAHHRVVDLWRTAHPHASLDDGGAGAAEASRLAASHEEEPPVRVERGQDLAAMLAAISALRVEQRDAFLLQAEGGLSIEEIATATGTNFETAKSRLRYARERLRHRLRELMP